MRLIDVEPLMRNGWSLQRTGVANELLATMSLADVFAIDAVPVIRCPDCKYSFIVTDQDGGRHLCCAEHGRRDMKDDDFCSYGELRK